MVNVEGKMQYKLSVDTEKESYSINYESTIENEIASLMVATQVLGVQLNNQKEFKKTAKGKANKDAVGSNIAKISSGIAGINSFLNALLNNYEDYKKFAEEQKRLAEEKKASDTINPPIPE